jgi:hypothetical protein
MAKIYFNGIWKWRRNEDEEIISQLLSISISENGEKLCGGIGVICMKNGGERSGNVAKAALKWRRASKMKIT